MATIYRDMELIDILYMQDIDIGVEREAFDTSHHNENKFTSELDEKALHKQDENVSTGTNHESSWQPAQLDLAGQYIIDSETGELVFNASLAEELNNTQQHQPNNSISQPNNFLLDVQNTPQFELMNPSFFENAATITAPVVTEQIVVNNENQSNMDLEWNDIFSLLNVSSTISGIPQSDASLPNVQYNTSTAVVRNASMLSAAQPAINDSFTLQQNYSQLLHSQIPNYVSNGFNITNPGFSQNFSSMSTEQNESFTGMFDSNFGNDQLSNVDLFENMSYVHPGSRQNESFNTTSMNLTDASSSVNLLNAFDGIQSFGTSCDHNEPILASAISMPVVELDVNDVQDLLQQMLHSDLVDDIDLSAIIDDEELISTNVTDLEDWSSDSAVSSMSSPQQQSYGSSVSDFHVSDAYESGATGGLSKYELNSSKNDAADSDLSEISFPSTYQGMFGESSNFTDFPSSTTANTKSVNHNHTYPLPHGRKSREELEEEAKREKEERATRSRDEKRAKAMKIPMTMDQMIESSVEQFTELLSHYHLTEAQQQLVRDIRRRGKNKMAAQNCRKRKMEMIQTVEEQVTSLRERRDALRRERGELDRSSSILKDKFKRLESELFRRLHDESGREYDPTMFSLLQTDDGGLFIVPRTNTTSGECSAASDKTHEEKNGRKRKSKRKD